MATERERLVQIIADVFGVSGDSVDDDTSPDSIASWDSLSHIDLVLAIEAEFSVSLSAEDTMEMLSVGLIRRILEDHGVAFEPA